MRGIMPKYLRRYDDLPYENIYPMKNWHLLLALILFSPSSHAAMKTYTLDTQHQLASEMVPTLQALVSPGGTVTSFNNVLIIKTTPDNFEQLQLVIRQIDAPLQQLMISVTTDEQKTRNDFDIRLDDKIKTGDGSISTGRSNKNKSSIDYGNASAYGSGTQDVRTIEGQPAYVQIGEEIPVTRSNGWSSNTGYKTVVRGFYVTVHINGEHANVSISSQNDQVNQHRYGQQNLRDNSPQVEVNTEYTDIVINGRKHRVKPIASRQISTQGTSTRVRIKLGEWVRIGGIDESRQGNNNQLNSYSRGGKNQSSGIFIRIDPI